MYAKVLGAVLIVLVFVAGAVAQDATSSPEYRQWQAADQLLGKLYDDLREGGLPAAKPHVANIEAALEAAPPLFRRKPWGGGAIHVLVDGQSESMTAMLTAAAGAEGGDVVAIANPYHLLGLYLGSYYNEIGRHEDALRVLDTGLDLSFEPGALTGETIPDLLSERGAAFVALKRWDDALASYETGLAIPNLADYAHGLLLRGRGFALIELERLDEAKAAYEESLKYDPGNQIALGELQYIESLIAGGKKQPPNLTLSKPKN